MDQVAIMKNLLNAEPQEDLFSRIMEAETVQDLLDLHMDPNEFPALFQGLERAARYKEFSYRLPSMINEGLDKARPVRKRKTLFV